MEYNIPIEIFSTADSGCHLFIKANFSNKENGLLIIDTGANKTVFDKNLLANYTQSKEKINEEISSGINASIENSYRAKLDSIKIGGFELVNYEIILISLKHLNNIYEKIAKKKIWGLLGGDFLLHYEANINYKTKILTLEK